MSSIFNLKSLKLIGVLVIVYWFSLIVYLPPITPYPDLDSFVDETLSAKETLGPAYPEKIDLQKEKLKNELTKEINLMYAGYIVPMVLGLFSGILIYRKKILGQIIAIGLSAFFIIFKIYNIYLIYPHVFETYKLMMLYFPSKMVHEGIIGVIFYVGSLSLLLSPSVSKQFKTKAT